MSRCFQARLWSTRAVRQELPSLWDAGWLLPAQALGANTRLWDEIYATCEESEAKFPEQLLQWEPEWSYRFSDGCCCSLCTESFSQSEFPAVSLCHAKETISTNLVKPHHVLPLIMNWVVCLCSSVPSSAVTKHCDQSFDEKNYTKQLKAHLASKC